MKKLFYLLPLILLFPAMVLAAVNYSHFPGDSSVFLPATISITFSDYDKDINCGGLGFWGIQAVQHITGITFPGEPRFVSSAISSQTFTLNVPPGNYEEITYICSQDGENMAFQLGSVQNDLSGDQIIFTGNNAAPFSGMSLFLDFARP